MERLGLLSATFLCLLALVACKQEHGPNHDDDLHEITHLDSENQDSGEPLAAALKAQLQEEGFQIFDYIDEETGDTLIMQQYFIAFLKRGENRSQDKTAADSIQALHMAHLGRMYELGYADISGPFGDDGDIRGITIYNVPTLQMADSLANMDPAVQAGRLKIEVHPWWAAKGFPLR